MFSRAIDFRKAAFSALVVACGALAQLAVAHDFGGTTNGGGGQPPKDDRPCCNVEKPCRCPPDPTSGKPIDYWTGGETLTNTDLVVRGQFPITILRTYDSQSEYDSALGFGWAFAHDRALYEYPDSSVVLRLSSGSRERFVFGGGTYQSPAGGLLASLVQKPDGSFEMSYVDGTVDFFDVQGRLVAEQDRHGSRHEFTYDPAGKLPLTGTSQAAVDPNTPMVVAHDHRLTRIDERGTDGNLTGRYVTFAYNSTTGRVTSVTANDGRTVTYEHDITSGLTRGNLVEVNRLDGTVQSYGYTDPNDQHNVTSITEAVGRTPVVNTYDTQDRVIRQDEGTRRIEFNYQTPLVKTIVTRTIRDQNGLNPYTTVDTYDFDTSGRTTKHTDPLGHETRYIYSPSKDVSRKETWQKNGATLSLLRATDYTYDSAGRRLTESVTLDSGEVVTRTVTYDHDWIATEQTVSSANPSKIFRTEHTFFYDSAGRPKNIQSTKRRKDDGSFQTTSYTYDARDRRLTTTYADGVKRVNEYTGDYVTKVYLEVGGSEIPQLVQRFEYDAEGNKIKKWDARNNLTTYTYDDRGRVLTETNPLGEQSIYTYTDELLTLLEIGHTSSAGEGLVTKLNYDTRGRLTNVQRKDDAGVFQTFETYEFDSEGRRLSVTDALSRKTTFAYDLRGRPISSTDPANNVMEVTYDAADNQTSKTDPLDRVTMFEYDDLNRMTATVEAGASPAARSEYSYDAVGNLTAYKDGENRTTSYEYDSLSRNTKRIQPLGQEVSFVYDNRDRIDYFLTARNQKIDYTYETWGQLKEERQYPTSSATTPDRTITYVRDNDGNILSVADSGIQSGNTFTVTYDEISRPYDETIKYLPGGDRTLQHRYDRFGNRSQLTLQDGTPVAYTYTYNKLDRLANATLAGATVSRTYFGNDQIESVVLPGGVTRSYVYENNFAIDSISVVGPSGQLAQMTYAYDGAGNVDSLVDGDGSHSFDQDGLDRLIQASHPSGIGLPTTESFVYTAAGDRKDSASPSAWTYDSNHRIATSPGLTYTFDADGNLSSRSDSTTLTHDARQRLTQLVKSGVTSSYLHDIFGRRVRKTVGSQTTWFLWDGLRLLAEYSGSGIRTKRYAYLDDELVPTQVQDAAGTYYVHADNIEVPRLMTSSSGQVVWKARYESFGKAVVDTDPDGNSVHVELNLRLAGQYFDAESGWHYNVRRDYDPSAGRYIQSDPMGLRGGVNTYAYAGSNPLVNQDPSGEFYQARYAYTAGTWVGKGIGFGLGLALGVPLGVFIYDATHPDYDPNEPTEPERETDTDEDREDREREHERPKEHCDKSPKRAPGQHICSWLSKQIDFYENCVNWYRWWDRKWQPGRHKKKIEYWENRIRNLKDEYDEKCNQVCLKPE
jgi:RHS repeat-associated protein